MKIIGRKRSVILNFKLFIIFFPEELRARSTRESINLFQKCKILIMGLFRPLECLLGMVSVPDYGLCFVPCFGPSPTSIFFRTQISFWTKPNISESRNQLCQRPYQAFSKLSWFQTITSRHFWYYLKQFHQNNVQLSVPFTIKARKVCHRYYHEIKQTKKYIFYCCVFFLSFTIVYRFRISSFILHLVHQRFMLLFIVSMETATL